MNDEILASAKFIAKDSKHTYNITLDMIPHGGFDYGNRHSLVLDFHTEGSMPMLFDARYDSRWNTAESFDKYAYEFVREQVRKDLTIERVKEEAK